MAEVVADASVLIALAQIGQLSLLQRLFGEILIPAAVALEVSPSLPEIPGWIVTRAVRLLIVVGTAGVLFLAKERALIPAVRPVLDALRAANFRLRQDVYEEVLRAAGEVEE